MSSIERFASKMQPVCIQLQLVQRVRSTATGTGWQVCPARAHAAAKTPPAYGTSFQLSSLTGKASSTRRYHLSSVLRVIDFGQIRRPSVPRRSKTKLGARSEAA